MNRFKCQRWVYWTALAVIAGMVKPAIGNGLQRPLVLRSSRFVLHTDLQEEDAEQTLERMESVLDRAVKYWQTPSRRQIDCYVIRDLDAWSDAALPHKLARVWVGGIGGATISEFEQVHGKRRIKATVYAAARPGVVEHEVIHAYCFQTFGEAGPDWYKEGMAQLVSQPARTECDLGCPRDLTVNLGKHCDKKIGEIIQAGAFTDQMSASLGAMLTNRETSDSHVSMSVWKSQDAETVRRLEEHYRWSWSLCHVLLHNPNYAARFRLLGTQYLSDGKASFNEAFAAVSDQLSFEYGLFLKHAMRGYRVDLCRWDWNDHFQTLDGHRTIARHVRAARGFQPAGLQVRAGLSYDYTTKGRWSLSATGSSLTADGQQDGAGRMVGVVMNRFQLSDPFDLGREGVCTPPASGHLYVRCHDAWDQLADNQGEIVLRFTRPESDRN